MQDEDWVRSVRLGSEGWFERGRADQPEHVLHAAADERYEACRRPHVRLRAQRVSADGANAKKQFRIRRRARTIIKSRLPAKVNAAPAAAEFGGLARPDLEPAPSIAYMIIAAALVL